MNYFCRGGGIWQTRTVQGRVPFRDVGSNPTRGTTSKIKIQNQKIENQN